VADITYIRTDSGWLYLAAVLDLYSRKIVGWSMAPNMPASLVCTALNIAICQRQPTAGLIMHSDRGSQYASHEYRNLLDKQGLVGSMSRKGNCWDNSVMERFSVGTIKSNRFSAIPTHQFRIPAQSPYNAGIFYQNESINETKRP
jgi:transposase InsO family protein